MTRTHTQFDDPPKDHPEPEQLPAGMMSDEIEHHSPEGRPGDPNVGRRSIAMMIACMALAFLAAAAIVAITIRWEAGVAVAALGLLLLFLNPAVWGSILRAKERDRAADHVAHDVAAHQYHRSAR